MARAEQGVVFTTPLNAVEYTVTYVFAVTPALGALTHLVNHYFQEQHSHCNIELND